MTLFNGGFNPQSPGGLYVPQTYQPHQQQPAPAPAQRSGLDEQTFARMALGPMEHLFMEFSKANGGDLNDFKAAVNRALSNPGFASRVESVLTFGPSTQAPAPVAPRQPPPQQGPSQSVFTADTGLPPGLGEMLGDLREQSDNGRLVGITARRAR